MKPPESSVLGVTMIPRSDRRCNVNFDRMEHRVMEPALRYRRVIMQNDNEHISGFKFLTRSHIASYSKVVVQKKDARARRARANAFICSCKHWR